MTKQEHPPLPEPETLSYDRDKVPLHGMQLVRPEHCRIETEGECGCAFGQCAKGLIA